MTVAELIAHQEFEMVMYKGIAYYLIAQLGQLVEIAPTRHGAGSFVVHESLITWT